MLDSALLGSRRPAPRGGSRRTQRPGFSAPPGRRSPGDCRMRSWPATARPASSTATVPTVRGSCRGPARSARRRPVRHRPEPARRRAASVESACAVRTGPGCRRRSGAAAAELGRRALATRPAHSTEAEIARPGRTDRRPGRRRHREAGPGVGRREPQAGRHHRRRNRRPALSPHGACRTVVRRRLRDRLPRPAARRSRHTGAPPQPASRHRSRASAPGSGSRPNRGCRRVPVRLKYPA